MRAFLIFVALVAVSIADLPNVVDPARYTAMSQFDSKLTLYWTLDEAKGEIEFALLGQCKGYVAMGFSKTNSISMLNSDIIIGWVKAGVPTVLDYNIVTGRNTGCSPGTANGVCMDSARNGQNNILAFNGSETADSTHIIFTRKLVTGDDLDQPITNSDIPALYAWHATTDGPGIVQHSVIPTPGKLNFFTGAASSVTDYKLIHGSLMFIAWFGIAPFGFILARFMKGYTWWFNAHRILMMIAMAAQVAGFGIIVWEVPKGEHFDGAHKIIGLIVFIIGVSQPLIGFLADKLFDPNRSGVPIFPDKTHWVLGWVSITLGMINIILGLILYPKTKDGVLIAYCVGAAVVFAGCVGYAIFRIIKPVEASHK